MVVARSLLCFVFLLASSTTLTAQKVELETISDQQLEQLGKGSSESIRLVNFWATWCGPCREEFPELVEINRRFPDVELITVSVDQIDQQEQVVAFLEEYPMTGQSFIVDGDDPYTGLEAFDPEWKEMVPHTVVLHPKKGVIYRSEGVFDTGELIHSIELGLEDMASAP